MKPAQLTEEISPILERSLKDQEHVLNGTVSVAEIIAYIEQDKYLTLKEAAEYLPFCALTISKHLKEIPHFRYNRKLFFRKSELDQWAERWRVHTDDVDKAMQMAEEMLGEVER